MPLDGTPQIHDPVDIGNYSKEWLTSYYAMTKKGGREGSLGASNLNSCARRMVHEKIETPAPVNTTVNGYAFRGSTYEEQYLVPMVDKWASLHHARLLYAGDKQIRLRSGDLTATPDGLVISAPYNMLEPYGVVSIESDCFVVEFKTFDPRIGDDSLPKQGHTLQLNAQIGLFREMSVHRPKYGLLIYANASDPADIRRFVVEFDPDVYEGSKLRAKVVMDAVRAKAPLTMRPEGKIDDDGECDSCPYNHESTCGGYGFAVPKETRSVNPEIVAKLDNIAGRLDVLKTKEKAAAKGRLALEAEMKETLALARTNKVNTDRYTIRWLKQSGRKTFDKDAALRTLTDEGYSEAQFYKQGSSFDQLRYKRLTSNE